MKKFIAGYHAFREKYYAENRELLEDLMENGQTPTAMMIACSDSRIDPSLKFGAEPGDLFMVRNVANLVPPYAPDGDYHGTSAALEFAVLVLNVEHIIVMGHARCGGIGALIRHEGAAATDFVQSWMKIASPAYERAVKIATNAVEMQQICERESVSVSLGNLLTFPWIRSRVEAGTLELHGWYFDLATGTLYVLDADGRFAPA